MKLEKLLQFVFDEINTDFFGGELSRPYFTINNADDELASTYVWKDEIFINFSTFYTYDIFEIMAHEMIHVWQFENKKTGKAHGNTFKKIAKQLNKFYNLNIHKYQEVY